MRARLRLAVHLAALVAGGVLGACGSGLYDASGVPVIGGGGGQTCDVDQVSCDGKCKAQSATVCGTACEDCTATGVAPAHGIRACLRDGGAPGACGYECADLVSGVADGYVKCAAGCCGTTALAAGEKSTCALLDDAEVACWGANDKGQTGDGTTSTARTSPHAVPLPAAASAVAVGVRHACAVVQGAVWCWGENAAGQVTGAASGTPVLAPAASPVASGATAVVAGGAHTCALLQGGAVRCWGSNVSGQVGPAQPVVAGATAIAAGWDHTCALVAGGAVACWGSNASGQLGATPFSGIATPIASGVLDLAASADQTCAGKASNGTNLDDALRCWGDSLGPGWRLATPQTTPAIPMKDANTATIRYGVSLAAAGAHHVCVSKGAGEVVECLGANDFGQLGGAPALGESVPLSLPTLGARAVAAGAAHTCAAASDGRLRCWGANDFGQLGDGTTVRPAIGTPAIPLGR